MNPATYLAGLPAFLAYFGIAVLLLAAFAYLYTHATPYKEWQLIKANNPAAAVAYGGSILGFVLPLHSAISNSVNLIDCVLWGIVALVVQIATFFIVRLLIRDLPARIERGEIASGIFVAALSMAVGVLNAASMTY
jgi:putative membrane protein